ncbi:MAG: hypothetical protein HGA76_02100, partial [Candidatus Firestonebacteria bacterium]|nr:hypothetical protein [Candidatus Firestonebacteria bacterium]
MKIYISNLAFDISEEEVRQAFEAFGEVAGIELAKNSETGVLKGFGFIEMPNRFEAKAAITHLNDQKLKGRTLTVIEAQTAVDEPVQKAPEDSFKTQEKFSSAKNRDRKNPAPSHAASGKYSSTRNGYRPGQPVYAEGGASRRPNSYRSQTTRSAEGFRKPNPRPGGYPARPEGGYRSSAPRPGGGYPVNTGRPDGGYRSSAPRPGGGYPAKPGRPDGGYRSSAPR